jgi:hypothetical protein
VIVIAALIFSGYFGRKIRNVVGFHYKKKPAQRIPWQILRLKEYSFVFFGPILPEF